MASLDSDYREARRTTTTYMRACFASVTFGLVSPVSSCRQPANQPTNQPTNPLRPFPSLFFTLFYTTPLTCGVRICCGLLLLASFSPGSGPTTAMRGSEAGSEALKRRRQDGGSRQKKRVPERDYNPGSERGEGSGGISSTSNNPTTLHWRSAQSTLTH
jgi:hypothetical protein